MDSFSSFAAAARAAGAAAYEKGMAAAAVAGEAAAAATERAVRGAQVAAAHAARELAGGSASLALVGQTVTVLGRALVIEQLLAEGEGSSAHVATVIVVVAVGDVPVCVSRWLSRGCAGGFAAVYLATTPAGNKVVLKRMYAGVSV